MMKMQVKACGQNVFVGVEQRESERERDHSSPRVFKKETDRYTDA